MNKFTFIPGSQTDLDILLTRNIKEIIIGVKSLSIYPFELNIDEIINIAETTNINITIALNKMIHNSDLTLVREVLSKVNNSKIKKILFYDLGVFNIIKDMNIDKELIISQEHLNASIGTNNFYYNKGITNTFITSDITYKEINDIKNSTKMEVYYTVYGYLPIFYSMRSLLSNYFKYIKKDMFDNKYYIYNNDLKYMVKEYDHGTIIYSPLVNLLGLLDKIETIDNYVIDLSFNNNINILDSIDNINNEEVYTGFFNKETIYKLRSDSNE